MAAAHAGLGWLVGVSAPASDRRMRLWCVIAALIPDLDALAGRYHHTAGHNVFAGLIGVAAAAVWFRNDANRSLFTALGLVAASFAAHLLLDAVAAVPLHPLWPASHRPFTLVTLLPPGEWWTIVVAWLLIVAPWGLAFWRLVSPLELISPRLDLLFLNLFRAKNRECSVCSHACNNRCHACTHPVCFKHGKIDLRFRVTCPPCASGSAPKRAAEDVEHYLARELQFLRSKEAIRLDPEFSTFLYRKLQDGLRRLDDVPRTHPLWQGSDNRPTLAKLMDLSRTVLKESPDDDEARWVLFADKILTRSPDLGYGDLEPAILRDFKSLRWLVAAARWNYVFSGVDPVRALKAPLRNLEKTVGPVETFFETLKDDPDPSTKEAAGRCLELLKGTNPFKS